MTGRRCDHCGWFTDEWIEVFTDSGRRLVLCFPCAKDGGWTK